MEDLAAAAEIVKGKRVAPGTRLLVAEQRKALDSNGDGNLEFVTVELPTESLDFGELRTALEELLRQTVRHRTTLREAAEASRP